MEEKVFVICWGWGRKGKGDHGKFPATELGMRLGAWLSGAAGNACVYLQPTCLGRSSPWCSTGRLLEMGPGTEQQVEGGVLEGEICGIHRRWKQGVQQGRLLLVYCCNTGGETGSLDLLEQSWNSFNSQSLKKNCLGLRL